MTLEATALVLLSALLHATWNFLNKGSADRWAFFFAQGLTTMAFYVPILLWSGAYRGIGADSWAWVAASAVTHAGYGFFLLRAYDAGDFGVAYPLSRTAPVLVALWDVFVARGHVSPVGIAGALLSGAGAVVVQIPALRVSGPRAVLGSRVTRYALITSAFIAAFTVIDKQGVGRVHPFAFLCLISLGELAAIGACLGRTATARLAREMRGNGGAVVFVALVGPFSYLLILWSLATAPASYVLGVRQTSIVFGVLFGHFFLGEQDTRHRLAGAGIIAVGSILIAAAG